MPDGSTVWRYSFMKTLILFSFTLVVSATLTCAQTTAADILKDYKQKSAAALERLNKTLETQAASIAATLVGQGDAAGADELSKQIKAKIEGEAVLKPHSAAITLFRQYDAARTNALKPVQAASISKIEALLKTSAGKKMETVLELGKARQEIEDGKVVPPAPAIPEFWTYHRTETSGVMAEMAFKPDGTYQLIDPDPKLNVEGKWEATKDPNVITLDHKGNVWKITFNGDKATIDRPDMGLRFLKVKSR